MAADEQYEVERQALAAGRGGRARRSSRVNRLIRGLFLRNAAAYQLAAAGRPGLLKAVTA